MRGSPPGCRDPGLRLDVPFVLDALVPFLVPCRVFVIASADADDALVSGVAHGRYGDADVLDGLRLHLVQIQEVGRD